MIYSIALISALFSATVRSYPTIQNATEMGMYIYSAEPSMENRNEEHIVIEVNGCEEFAVLAEEGYSSFCVGELLADESIPQEDRYWLDCRVRSAIAQVAHIVYTDTGDEIVLDADWVYPGESYWQETLIVNPHGDPDSENSFTDQVTIEGCFESGYLVDLYGTQVGEIALASKRVRLSRSGVSGALQTGLRSWNCPSGDMYFTKLFSDGSTVSLAVSDEFRHSRMSHNISQDGEITSWSRIEDEMSELVIMNSNNEIFKVVEVPYLIEETVISPDNQYVAFSGSVPSGSGIYDIANDELILFEDGGGRIPYISQNSEIIVMTSGYINGNTVIYNTEKKTGHLISNQATVAPTPRRHVGVMSVSNNQNTMCVGSQVFQYGEQIVSMPEYRESALSPNGIFVMMYGDSLLGDSNLFDSIAIVYLHNENCNRRR